MRSTFNFKMVDVAPGAELQFVKDQTITATVVDDRRINFEGQITSLSKAALTVIHRMGYTWKQIQGPAYWEYDHETLADRRQRMEGED